MCLSKIQKKVMGYLRRRGWGMNEKIGAFLKYIGYIKDSYFKKGDYNEKK